jgi:hypothetical protein
MAKKLPKQAIKDRIEEKILVKLTAAEAKAASLLDDQAGGSYNQESPHVSLKYFPDAFECSLTGRRTNSSSSAAFSNISAGIRGSR